MLAELLQSGFHWPSGTTIRRARPRLDIAAMLMTRRFFHTVLQQSFDLHLTADSSPVTGMDIFGAEVDIFSHACKYRKFTLPGATLAHGHTSALSKALSLTWSLWLVSGPSMASLESVLEHLRSITSDWGGSSPAWFKPRMHWQFSGRDLASQSHQHFGHTPHCSHTVHTLGIGITLLRQRFERVVKL